MGLALTSKRIDNMFPKRVLTELTSYEVAVITDTWVKFKPKDEVYETEAEIEKTYNDIKAKL